MPPLEAGRWGVVGAAAALTIVYVIPTGLQLAQGKARPNLAPWRIIGALVVLVGTLFLGGISAIAVGSGDVKQALTAGLAYQSTISGLIKRAAR